MQKLRNHVIGIDQGQAQIFSDFETNGEMWSGVGPRSRMVRVTFSEKFKAKPVVHLSIDMFDMDNRTNQRTDITSENIDKSGFDVVFKTWGDSKIARVRAAWLAIGEVYGGDEWAVD